MMQDVQMKAMIVKSECARSARAEERVDSRDDARRSEVSGLCVDCVDRAWCYGNT